MHGDNAGPGLGSYDGLGCLLLGWCSVGDGLNLAWGANLALALAVVLFALGRFVPAFWAAALACALGFLTPVMLTVSQFHPVAFPRVGYYLWQASLIATMAIACLLGARHKAVRALEVLLIGMSILALQQTPGVFRERERGIRVRVTGRLVLPEEVPTSALAYTLTLPDVHLDIYPRDPIRFTHYSPELKLTPKTLSLDTQLRPLGRPQTVQFHLESPLTGAVNVSQPFTCNDNIYEADLGELVVPSLDLHPLDGPQVFHHPSSLNYTVTFPSGWHLTPVGKAGDVLLQGPQDRKINILLTERSKYRPNYQAEARPGTYSASDPVWTKGNSWLRGSSHWQRRNGSFVEQIQLSRSVGNSYDLVVDAQATAPTRAESQQRLEEVRAVVDSL